VKEIDPKSVIETHERTANWEYQKEADFWYEIAKIMDNRFFNGLVYPDGKRVPTPIIAFDNLRNKNTLACYDLFPDEYGLIGKITFNTEHYNEKKEWDLGRYSQGETLLHEYIHLWQQIGRGKDPYSFTKHRRNTHNKEFVTKAEELGIHPMPGSGVHTQIATPGSPIDILLREVGIRPPEKAYEKPEDSNISWADWLIVIGGGETKKGRSSLNNWVCPECRLHARIGIKGNPEIVHDPCSEKLGRKVFFVRAEILHQTIYKAPETIEPDPDEEIHRQEEEKEENYNQFDDPEDLSAYLEPYQNL